MRNYHRWAALAGAAFLTVANVTVSMADVVGGGESLETAVTVAGPEDSGQTAPAGDASQQPGAPLGEQGATAQENQNQTQDPGSAPQPSEGTANRVIRVGDGQSSGAAADSGSTAAPGGSGSSSVDYSQGPGFFPGGGQTAPSQTALPGQSEDIQIFDVTNPVVLTTAKYSYDQMVQDINTLQQKYSSRMHVNPIGTSLDGRAIYDCIIGNQAAPRHILIQGGIHGREYLNPMLLMQQMEMILVNYDTGSFHGNPLSSMFDQVAIHFVPMTNPDGVTISQFGIDGIRSQQLKDAISTCYVMDSAAGRGGDLGTYLSRWKANAQGVDLNLNFDALWAEVYSVGYPSYSGFKGTAPGSEPETQAMMNLYSSQYPWKAVIHYHSMGDVIYWDIPGNKVQPESAQLANLMSVVTGGYRMLPSEGGGGYKDWIQLGNNPVPSVTLETGRVSCPIPISEYALIWAQNRLTWAYAMEWVMGR